MLGTCASQAQVFSWQLPWPSADSGPPGWLLAALSPVTGRDGSCPHPADVTGAGGQEPPQIAACRHPPNPNPVYPELAEAPVGQTPQAGPAGRLRPSACHMPQTWGVGGVGRGARSGSSQGCEMMWVWLGAGGRQLVSVGHIPTPQWQCPSRRLRAVWAGPVPWLVPDTG